MQDRLETDEELKNRHRNFYHLAKYLRECIECFGMDLGEYHTKDNVQLNVFHGLDKIFAFSSLNARIHGPLSMTTSYTVAQQFAITSGVILSMEISAEWYMSFYEGQEAFRRITCCDCQYWSDFTFEQEIFTIGGINTVKIQNIFEIETAADHILYISALSKLTVTMCDDEMDMTNLRGSRISTIWQNQIKEESNTDEQIQMAFRLLAHELWRAGLNHEHAHEFKSCPPYIKDLLHAHFERLKFVSFMAKTNYVLDVVFKYKNEWIKLHLLCKVFPNLEGIGYGAWHKNMKWLKDVVEHVLYFVSSAGNNGLERIIVAIDSRLAGDISRFIENYEAKFRDNSWVIGCDSMDLECMFGRNWKTAIVENNRIEGRKLRDGWAGYMVNTFAKQLGAVDFDFNNPKVSRLYFVSFNLLKKYNIYYTRT